MDQQKITELVIGLATIFAAVYLIESGAISGTVGFAAIVAVAAALGAYEAGRKQPQPGTEESDETPRHSDEEIRPPDEVPSAETQSISSSAYPDEPAAPRDESDPQNRRER